MNLSPVQGRRPKFKYQITAQTSFGCMEVRSTASLRARPIVEHRFRLGFTVQREQISGFIFG